MVFEEIGGYMFNLDTTNIMTILVIGDSMFIMATIIAVCLLNTTTNVIENRRTCYNN